MSQNSEENINVNHEEEKDRNRSDASKLAQKHMEDEDHVFTDEELRAVKVGSPPAEPDAPTEEAIRDGEDRIADKKADKEGDTTPGAQKMNPWDVIDPTKGT